MTAIVLFRRGETEWDRQNRLHGTAPVPLTEAGRESVETVGRELASTYDFDRLYAADTPAARESAAILRLAGVEPTPRAEPAWRPRDAGALQGLAYDRLRLADEDGSGPRTDVDVLRAMPPEGETIARGRDRVLDRWRSLREDLSGDERVLVVVPDFPFASILGTIAGCDPVNDLARFAPGACETREIAITAGEPTIRDEPVRRERAR